jgi:class 3 adenylate cyclase
LQAATFRVPTDSPARPASEDLCEERIIVPEIARHPTTVLFVDIVGSTELAAEIGDERWAVLLERYQELFRRELAAAGGVEMDTAGDGLFATFVDAADAVSFACALRTVAQTFGLRLRAGAHTGTCWVAGDKCTGLDVNIGARIAAASAPDETLVSAPVRDRLAADPRFELRERGVTELQGVPGRWALYAVERKEEASDDHDQGSSRGVPQPQTGGRDGRVPNPREPRQQRRLHAPT